MFAFVYLQTKQK